MGFGNTSEEEAWASREFDLLAGRQRPSQLVKRLLLLLPLLVILSSLS